MSLNRVRTALLVVMALLPLLGACNVRYQRHLLGELNAEVRPGLLVKVRAHGSWKTVGEPPPYVEVNGSPYVIEVAVAGVEPEELATITVSSLEFRDVTTATVVVARNWDEPVLDMFADSPDVLLFVDRSGISLLPGDKVVQGSISVGPLANRRVFEFSGSMPYSYRVERKNRLLEAIRGI